MQRLRETYTGTETLEGRVAFLLRATPAPAPLSSVAVERMATVLPLAPKARPSSRMLSWPINLLLTVSLALASSVALHRVQPSRLPVAPAPVAQPTIVEDPVTSTSTALGSPTSVAPTAPPPSGASSAPSSHIRVKARSAPEPEEAALLRRILELAKSPRGANQALDAIADYRRRFPAGTLGREADLAEVRADVALDRRREAIETLDQLLSLSDPPRAAALSLLRGELLAKQDRCTEALASWSALAVQSSGENERLLHGRASCLATLGRWSESQAVYRAYLKAFPQGRFAGDARVALSGWDEQVDE
jgi:tetratricopeptide (TPR) repeat protein